MINRRGGHAPTEEFLAELDHELETGRLRGEGVDLLLTALHVLEPLP
jgi:hypothetical protein